MFSNRVRVCESEKYAIFKRLFPLWASVLFLMSSLWVVADDLVPVYWQGKRLWSIDCILGQKVVAGGTYSNNTMFQTIYNPGLYYINFDTLCVDTHADLFELFSVTQPTIMDCGWVVRINNIIYSHIFDIPVTVFNSFSDCLVEEGQ